MIIKKNDFEVGGNGNYSFVIICCVCFSLLSNILNFCDVMENDIGCILWLLLFILLNLSWIFGFIILFNLL